MTEPSPDLPPDDLPADDHPAPDPRRDALLPNDLLAHERRDAPPAPAAATVDEPSAGAGEGDRETLETVRSISRLEESN